MSGVFCMGRLTNALGGAVSAGDNIRVELNEAMAEQYKRALAKMLIKNPDTKKRLRAVIRKKLKEARSKTSKDVRSYLTDDPRKAYRAVKHSVYKKILGGNISILASRKAGTKYQLVRARKLDNNPHQRGGNRVERSERTKALDTYFGKDRGFVLRFLNSGTGARQSRLGNRGAISARGLFEHTAIWHMDEAAQEIAAAFESEFEKIYKEESK